MFHYWANVKSVHVLEPSCCGAVVEKAAGLFSRKGPTSFSFTQLTES